MTSTTTAFTADGSRSGFCGGDVNWVGGTLSPVATFENVTTGLSKILAAGATNSETHTEGFTVVYNSNNGTADSSDGTLHIYYADSTNNTGNWWAVGIV